MCETKACAKSKAERLIESIDRLTQAIEAQLAAQLRLLVANPTQQRGE